MQSSLNPRVQNSPLRLPPLSRSFRRTLILAIKAYQRLLSPWLPPCCRFYPTCSQYAIQAIAQHGALRGSWLTIKRIARCHPLNRNANMLDPVPEFSPNKAQIPNPRATNANATTPKPPPANP